LKLVQSTKNIAMGFLPCGARGLCFSRQKKVYGGHRRLHFEHAASLTVVFGIPHWIRIAQKNIEFLGKAGIADKTQTWIVIGGL